MLIHTLQLAAVVTAALTIPLSVSAEIVTDLRPVLYDTETPDRLYIDGPIDIRTSTLFNKALVRYPNATTLVLSSPGGVVHSGLSLAYAVRAAGLNTHIPADAFCASACSYVFLAGIGRTADGGLGVHRLAHATDSLEAGQIALADVIAALTEFDVPIEIVNRMLATPADDLYVFWPEELDEIGVLGVSEFLAPKKVLSIETLIGCENSEGDRLVVVEFEAQKFEGRALNCVSGPFVVDMSGCAPDGAWTLHSPTGLAHIERVVDRWQDYGTHTGGIVHHWISASAIHFSGNFAGFGGLTPLWTLMIDRIDGIGTLEREGTVEELSCYEVNK